MKEGDIVDDGRSIVLACEDCGRLVKRTTASHRKRVQSGAKPVCKECKKKRSLLAGGPILSH